MDYKILLTGCEGQLGSYLFLKLKELFNVIPTSKRGNKHLEIKKLDISKSNEVRIIINYYKPNIIINSAALTNVDYCENNRQIARNINVGGLNNLIKYSNQNTKFIQISTDYVFDGKDKSYNENSSPNPINYYGKTKLEAENLLIGSQRPYIIIRPNTLYSSEKNNFFSWVYRSLIKNEQINVANDQISNPSFVPSLTSSIIDIILMNGKGIYHHGSKDIVSRYEFSIKIAEKFNFNKNHINKIKTESLNQIARRPLYSILDCSKLEEDFDLKMCYLDECLENIYLKFNYA